MLGDWVQDFYIERSHFGRTILEHAVQRADMEVDAIVRLLEEHGVSEGGRVLDVCCGIGRHSVRLADRGYHVTGVDISPEYVQRAGGMAVEHGVQERTEFLVGDARRLTDTVDESAFDAVLILFTSIGYYDDDTDRDIIRGCAAAAREGALLILDVSSRDFFLRNFRPSGVSEMGDTLVAEQSSFDLETSRLTNTWTYFERVGQEYEFVGRADIDLRLYSLHELVSMVEEAGWGYHRCYDGFSLDAASMDGSRLFLLAHRRSAG